MNLQKRCKVLPGDGFLPETGLRQPAAPAAGSTKTDDVTAMTPNRMQAVAQDLFESGRIDFTQLFMLESAGIPFGKQGSDGEFIPLSEAEKDSYRTRPMNYIQISRNAMQYLKSSDQASDPTSGYAAWSGILAALQGL